ENIRVTTFDYPFFVGTNEALHVSNAVLKGAPLRAALECHCVQRQAGCRMPGNKFFREGALASACIAKKYKFHRSKHLDQVADIEPDNPATPFDCPECLHLPPNFPARRPRPAPDVARYLPVSCA